MKNSIKNGLFIFLFIILLLPFIQQYFPFITSEPLYGYLPAAPDFGFSWSKWWAGTYRDEKGTYINDNIGFRPDLIRANNQVDYTLFNKINTSNVVAGSNHSLYMGTYIDCYFGKDYIGYDAILEKMKKFRALSDTLARLGKSLILVHSPSKEFMYPEYIPGSFKNTTRSTTNFETYLRIGDSLKINQLDFNTWFCSMKNTSKELLYPKQGIHWSVYGSYLAADSLIKYIEKLRNIHMPHPVWTRIVHTDQPRDSDNDIEKILNLIYPVTTEIFSYPEVSYTDDPAMVKPNVIYIGDSFLQIWLTDGVMAHVNKNWQFWLLFYLVFEGPDGRQQKNIPEYDWINAINNTDCIVLMNTSINLSLLGHGFIEKAYDHYFPKKNN